MTSCKRAFLRTMASILQCNTRSTMSRPMRSTTRSNSTKRKLTCSKLSRSNRLFNKTYSPNLFNKNLLPSLRMSLSSKKKPLLLKSQPKRNLLLKLNQCRKIKQLKKRLNLQKVFPTL